MSENNEFINEDDLKSFEGWMNYQRKDISAISSQELEVLSSLYNQLRRQSDNRSKLGRMKLGSIDGQCLYAVAVEEGSNLWLTLWVRRSPKGEFFVMLPRTDGGDHHTSYHLDGALHRKAHGRKDPSVKLQPLTGDFRGVVGLGTYYGHGPKTVGAVCEPDAFTSVVKVPSGVLGPAHGGISVYLVEPGIEPPETPWKNIVAHEVFQEYVPNVAITVGCNHEIA